MITSNRLFPASSLFSGLRALLAVLLAAVSLAVAAATAVDVNRASEAELQTVRGIGPAMSAKILQARQQGQFKDWADLVDRVPGVGARSAARLSEAGLTVGGQAYAGAAGAGQGDKAAAGKAVAKVPANPPAAAK